MKGIFYDFHGNYIMNAYGLPTWTTKRDNATVFENSERETVAAKLKIKPGELTFEEL